jgi:Ca2+-transporting ATPase
MYYKENKVLYKELKTSSNGLSSSEAKKRINQYGLNEIKEKEGISPLKIFISQFHNFIIYILLVALIVSIFVGEKIDAIVIGAILVLNAVLGFIQEYKAEKAIEALKKMASLKAKVLRDGKEQKIDASQLVPGDIIILETGDKVPADARLIEVINLQTQEAALTGESVPVKKELVVLDEKTPVADRINMVFSSTIVTKGRARALIASTGMNTEIGKIAEMIQTTETVLTPLQIKLKQLGKFMGIAVIIIAVVVFLVGLLKAELSPIEMFIASVALAVAAIPEGLPAVVTISLALGVQRMIKRNALVRKLPSVETLGSTTVICSDKTGTLTCNEMTVRKMYFNNNIIDVSGEGYLTKGDFKIDDREVNAKDLSLLLQVGALCNDSKLEKKENIGDPTEIALVVSAAKAGLDKDLLDRKYHRIGEIQFTSERKIMSTFHKIGGKKTIYTKGAPDVILNSCNRILVNGKIKKLNKLQKKKILAINDKFAEGALRVLGFAYNEGALTEKNLIFIGLQAMMDPARPEVRLAIEQSKKAGIKVVMITGDHIVTAKAIAKELGIEGNAIEGKDLDKIKDLKKHVETVNIYARVNPEHKSKILEALRKNGHIIAMTGDGVNDAPALKKADIGVAMGITGTDVSKEASDMILVDDNFASIVNAIEEGRSIYSNIKKFVEYLLSSNLGEVLTIFVAIMLSGFFGNALPLLAIHILWINLVTDGFPALALGVEPVEKGLMDKPPRHPKERILSEYIIIRMALIGVIMMAGTLFMFKWYLPKGVVYAQTMAFTTLMMFQMFNVLNCRSEDNSLFKVGVFSNMWLIGAMAISILLQVAVIHTPLASLFKTVPLTLIDWGYVVFVSSSVFIGIEILKFVRRLHKVNV